jgi:tripartite-type tricarboxylate transporter receptor subunit TctC
VQRASGRAVGSSGRRRILSVALSGVVACAFPRAAAFAQAPRGGAVRLVVGFPPGGSVDHVARILAPALSRELGRGVIVENVPGANSARAIARVAASEPNGDTLLLSSSAIAHPDNAAAAASLRPVILVSTAPMVLVVRASLPARDPREFAAYLASHGQASYGSSGVGNPTHLAAARLVEYLRADAVHVPYSGSALAFADLVAGRIDFVVTASNSSLSGHPAVRALAVTTGARSRLAGLDRLPTIAETLVPGFDFGLWQAVFVPASYPDAAVATLNAQFRDVLALEPVRAALAEGGVEVVAGSPGDAERVYRAEIANGRERAQR